MNRYVIVSSLTLFIYCFTSIFNVNAATNGGDPTQRSDGRLCVQVSGGIQNMREETGPAGITYYAAYPNQTIQAPFTVSPPFEIAMYDADGVPNTAVSFKNGGSIVWEHEFKTSNNQWSETLPVTMTVNTFEVILPTDHASTHVCILQSQEQTPTPAQTATSTETVTPTATNTPMLPTMTATATDTQEPSTATPTATNTPVPLVLATNTPMATNTSTPTATGTPAGQAVISTPTSVVEPPTGLDPSREPSVPQAAVLYLPLIVR